MSVKIGYLLPTRESIMEGRPEAEPLLNLAERAEGLGYDSVWVGDSLLARPRHEPITAGRCSGAHQTRQARHGRIVADIAQPGAVSASGGDARSGEFRPRYPRLWHRQRRA